MDRTNPYFKQVSLLVRALPVVGRSKCCALKGGTAINLFIRNMPRLSVDIDLVYLPIKGRDESLHEITAEMERIENDLRNSINGISIQRSYLNRTKVLIRLILELDRAKIKIEISAVLRGTVYKGSIRKICAPAEELFGYAEVPVVSFEDLFGGKIVAALDRQHPRDLFDVKYLLENEGISEKLKKAFIVYLISHDRTIYEVLNPTFLDIEEMFLKDFQGMTTEDVDLDELKEARVRLVDSIKYSLTREDKEFLLAFKRGNPNWTYFPETNIKDLPAVKWKQHNLDKIEKKKRMKMIEQLERSLL